MRKLILSALAMVMALGAFAQNSFKVDITNRHQTHEGWGVSLCWWAAMCGRFDEARVDSLVDWLVSPEGLNYNIFRYNIGGGDDPYFAHCMPHHMCFPKHGKGYRAEFEGFQDERGGAYHWERDSAQRMIMLKIREKRPDAIFEAFSNSAPWWMTISGCVGGNMPGETDNLDPEYYEDFAHYLVDVCKHYKDVYGLEFKTLEPFNEALSGVWETSGSQEGCHFDSETQVKFLRVLEPILKASGLNTMLAASDESWAHQALSDLKVYKEQDAFKMLGQWNVHSYHGTPEEKRLIGQLAREAGLRLWQSETGGGSKGIAGNLMIAQRLIEDIKCYEPIAWVDWQYVEERGDQWSLVNCNHTWSGDYHRHQNYYVRQHFSKYIKQGYTFVETDDPDGLSAISPDGKTLVYVTLNATEEPRTLSTLMPKKFAVAHCSKTEATAWAQPCSDYTFKKNTFTTTLPALSIMTVVLEKK